MFTREHEIWGMALWVEKHHADDGQSYIDNKVAELEAGGELEGAMLWQQVAERYKKLRAGPVPIHGQPETWPN